MALSHTQEALMEIERIETRLIELKKLIRTTTDRGQRHKVTDTLREARVAVNAATSQEKS